MQVGVNTFLAVL